MTLWELAGRLVGEVKEQPGLVQDPFIQWCHSSVGLGTDAADEIAWCSSFVNRLAWLLRLPRSKSAAARSWLTVGVPVDRMEAKPGNDVVIIKRGTSHGPEVTSGAPGHVGLFGGWVGDKVAIRGGNQGNGVSDALFPAQDVLGIRRLA